MSYRNRVTVFLCALTTLTYLDRICISIVGARVKSDLHFSNEQFGWVLAAFSLSYAIFEIPSGALGDRIGPRSVFIRIVLLWSIFTALTGVVSGLGREIKSVTQRTIFDVIQTDASINPGNSGGPLVNLNGQVVGINTAILAPGGGNIGIGFAVPISMARRVMEELIRSGEVKRGRIGVEIQDLTPDIAQAMNTQHTTGAIIRRVEQGSPADRAGLRSGDLVVATTTAGPPVLARTVHIAPCGRTLGTSTLASGAGPWRA